MKSTDKTFEARLHLREAAIDRWLPGQELRVLDLGAGEGLLWTELKKLYKVGKYVAVDKSPKMTATIGSRVDIGFLSSIGLSGYNFVDIECESDTLEIWLTVAMFITVPTIVTLSINRLRKEWLDKKAKALLGLPAEMVNVPADDKLHAWIETAAIQRGIQYAHADESYLTFNHKNKVLGAAFWCPGRKS